MICDPKPYSRKVVTVRGRFPTDLYLLTLSLIKCTLQHLCVTQGSYLGRTRQRLTDPFQRETRGLVAVVNCTNYWENRKLFKGVHRRSVGNVKRSERMGGVRETGQRRLECTRDRLEWSKMYVSESLNIDVWSGEET